MEHHPTAVTAELSLRMVVDPEHTVEVPCSLEYRAEDPFAVRATFRTGFTDIEWMFGRDLLLEGLQRPSGEGDILMWPERQGRARLLLVVLNPPSGQAVLECDSSHVEQFLRRTFDIVPLAQESASMNMDAGLEAILSDAPEASCTSACMTCAARARRRPSVS